MSNSYGAADPAMAIPEPVVRTGPRPTTIVWGIILIVIGGGLIVSQLANFHIEAGTALIGVVGLAGVLLVVGSAIGAIRHRSEERKLSEPPTDGADPSFD